MGRAIVRDPKLFLFDEPLSNLDAKLRVQMRAEIRKLQRRLGVTSLYVTHDQVEAMTLGDRLLIMHQGQPAQLATPMQVFEYPADIYVAGFVGSPTMNFLPGRLVRDGTAVQLDAGLLVPLPGPLAGDAVVVGIRPEHLTLAEVGLSVSVDLIEPLGSETLVHGRVGGAEGENIAVKLSGAVTPTETMTVAIQFDHAHVFDARTGRRIGPVGGPYPHPSPHVGVDSGT
jgi:sn-glycerol 3-phosphate transport system ATP-binding protein